MLKAFAFILSLLAVSSASADYVYRHSSSVDLRHLALKSSMPPAVYALIAGGRDVGSLTTSQRAGQWLLEFNNLSGREATAQLNGVDHSIPAGPASITAPSGELAVKLYMPGRQASFCNEDGVCQMELSL